MPRNFYSSAIVFTTVYACITLLKSIVYLLLGFQATYLQSISGWTTFELLVSLACSTIMLKYYHSHKYTFTFWALILVISASLFHFFSFLKLLQTRELMDYFIIATIVSLGASILYAISLITSATGKRLWLKIAGILLLILGLIMALSIIWALNSTSFMQSGTLSRVELWVSLAGVLVPVSFILLFLEEKKTSPKEGNSNQKLWATCINFMTFLVLVGGLYFSLNLIMESISITKNAGQTNEHQRKSAEPFEAGIYVNTYNDTLRYRLLKPLNYDSTRQYPLVVCLHGSSGSGNDNVKQIASSLPVPLLSKPENRAKYPAFLFVPQCPAGKSWGGINNFPAIDSLVFEAIETLKQKLPLDTNRFYVAGNSLGGYGAWHFISTRPTLFAAAIPISGAGDAALAHNIVNIPVWAFHGAKDRNVPVSGSRVMIEAMRKAGANPRYTEYPDKAHNIWNEVSDTPELLDWLFAQMKNQE